VAALDSFTLRPMGAIGRCFGAARLVLELVSGGIGSLQMFLGDLSITSDLCGRERRSWLATRGAPARCFGAARLVLESVSEGIGSLQMFLGDLPYTAAEHGRETDIGPVQTPADALGFPRQTLTTTPAAPARCRP
jgi:hypothetical protein